MAAVGYSDGQPTRGGRAYITAAGITGDRKGRGGKLSERPFERRKALEMVKRRAAAAGLTERLYNHSFRATGITAYLVGGGEIEKARQMAAHASTKTTELYNRTGDEITLDEVERIAI